MEFLHTMIRVKNIEKSLDFYEKLLEMKVIKQKQFDDGTLYFLADKNDIIRLELTYCEEMDESGYEIGDGFGHLAFKLTSMDNFTEKLHKRGYEYLKKPYRLTPTGSIIAFMKDPDGYEIELIEK